ncbi:MAG: cysteine desulfurase [Aureispira sp.]|nr:cysteine desulfurase [Aureispira sp.]
MVRIYLDNAASTPLAPQVLEAMLPFFQTHFGNPSSVHAEGRQAKVAIETARKYISKQLGSPPKSIIFTSGGTESNNMAIKCAVRDLGIKRIITSPIEHACVANAVANVQTYHNIEIEYVKLGPTGAIDLIDLTLLLSKNKGQTLVSLMHANNELGTLNNVTKIGLLCKKHGAYFHSDTVQTIGHLPINTKKLNIDFLSGSAHKMHGPKGSGFLYINPTISIKPFIDGGGQERQMRSGTENVANIVGLHQAFKQATQQMGTWKNDIEALRLYFIKQLTAHFPDIIINSDPQDYLYTILHVAFPCTLDLSVLLFRLDLEGISASAGSACNSGAIQSSPISDFLDLDHTHKALRFSFSHLNTKTEIDKTITILDKIVTSN